MESTSTRALPNPRQEGLKTIGRGVLGISATIGSVALAARLGWSSVMLNMTLLLLGWVYLGFGVGAVLFGRRLRIVAMLLAVLLGFVGTFVSMKVIHDLGFELRR